MALEITKDSKYNYTATYWTVAITNINWITKNAIIILYGYKDQNTKTNSLSPIIQLTFVFGEQVDVDGKIITEFPFKPEDNIVAKSYELIKMTPEFVESLDIMEIK